MYKKYGRYTICRLGRRKSDVGEVIHRKSEEVVLESKGVQCISEIMFAFCEF